MQIRQVILKGVRNFHDFKRSFEDEWNKSVPDALLLTGPNGSGKTTLLDVIAELWELLAQSFDENSTPSFSGSLLEPAKLAAIEVVGLERKSVWVVYTGPESGRAWEPVITEHKDDYRIYFSRSRDMLSGAESSRFYYISPGERTFTPSGGAIPQWKQEWSRRLEENILGKLSDLPNMVYLESETRTLPTISQKFTVQREPEEFHWLARYEPKTSRKGSLQNYLYNLRVVDESAFQQIIKEANGFLTGKRLDGFDKRTGDLIVKIEGGGQHPSTDLSSGEKQVLLMLASITRWLRPGGIVLIDEPDLHLHPALTTAFVGHLRRMIARKKGHLIIASHALELLQDFTPSHRVELGRVTELA